MDDQIAPVLAVLERRLESAESLAPLAEESFRTLLDRMISMTHDVFPAVSDLARELRYRCFDQPLFDKVAMDDQADFAHRGGPPEMADQLSLPGAEVRCRQFGQDGDPVI